MKKTIFITGSTDGIGLKTAEMLVLQGHHVLLHGRNPAKLAEVEKSLSALEGNGCVDAFVADLSCIDGVETLVKIVAQQYKQLDVLINNAGVFKTPDPISQDGLDIRFAVNTIAPYLLTQKLLPLIGASGRVINLASAAQSPVDLEALAGRVRLSDDFSAYAQSKLALIMWSRSMALRLKNEGPVIVAVNPGSLLGTKMVKEGFGMAGNSIDIGAKILIRAALSEDFAAASGQYFDNDSGQFTLPHPDALDPCKSENVVGIIEATLLEMAQKDN